MLLEGGRDAGGNQEGAISCRLLLIRSMTRPQTLGPNLLALIFLFFACLSLSCSQSRAVLSGTRS